MIDRLLTAAHRILTFLYTLILAGLLLTVLMPLSMLYGVLDLVWHLILDDHAPGEVLFSMTRATGMWMWHNYTFAFTGGEDFRWFPDW